MMSESWEAEFMQFVSQETPDVPEHKIRVFRMGKGWWSVYWPNTDKLTFHSSFEEAWGVVNKALELFA